MIETRWQIIGMHNAGISCSEIVVSLNIHHTVISRIDRKQRTTVQIKDRQWSGLPRNTSARDDRRLVNLAYRTALRWPVVGVA